MLENMVNFYLAPNLPADRHAFFGRNGGVSEGIYASFNFNRKSRDKAENIVRKKPPQDLDEFPHSVTSSPISVADELPVILTMTLSPIW